MPKSWLDKRKKDKYYRLAKKEDYRSRAAYKLKQINERFSVIRKGDVVVDLGCAPGGWSQVAMELVGERGKVIGVDLKQIKPIENVVFIKGDMNVPETIERIRDATPQVDVIISDMSPPISGNRSYDQARFLELGENALRLSERILRYNGNLVIKMFQGELFGEFLGKVRSSFRSVSVYRAGASIKSSAEVYIVAKGYVSRPAL